MVTYTYYLDTWQGQLSEADFNRLVVKAHDECVSLTNFKAVETDHQVEMFNKAVCSHVDFLYNGEDNQVSSYSLGDLSVNYNAENQANNVNNISVSGTTLNYLRSTGLLYSGITGCENLPMWW